MTAFRDGKEFSSTFSMPNYGGIIMISTMDLTKDGKSPMMVKTGPDGDTRESNLVFSMRSSSGDGKWWKARSYSQCHGAPTGEQLRRLRFHP